MTRKEQVDPHDCATALIEKKPPKAGSDKAPSSRSTASRRKRQAAIAAALDQLFKPFGECDPRWWDQRTFLLLVGIIHQRLSREDEDLPTEELIALAKTLAENRRSARGNYSAEPPRSLQCASGELPESFAEVVRQVYGTNARET